VSMKKQTSSRRKATTPKTKTTATKRKATSQATKVATRSARKASKTVLEKKVKSLAAPKAPAKPTAEGAARPAVPARTRARATTRHAPHVTRVATTSAAAQHRQVVRMARVSQFTFMKAPGIADVFDVGDTVEVFCDHERNGERVRGWIKGIVVQVDNKLVAVQFRSNVYLTDGWMVPDRILWYSLTSDQIRPATFAKRGSQRPIPDY
jgi:hypothetical protein